MTILTKLKSISRAKKIISISVIALAIYYFFFFDISENYSLANYSNTEQQEIRKIGSVLGKDNFEWFLPTPDGTLLFVSETGVGKTIVTLHGGFGMSHDYMRSFLKPYEEDFHMVYYDQRGSLRSQVPNFNFDKYITMENMVNDLEVLRRELGEKKLTVIAHSMGAVLAYEYMRKFPGNIEDIIIISGFVPKFPSNNEEFYDLFDSQKKRDEFINDNKIIKEEEVHLKKQLDTTRAEYAYLNWKLQSSVGQIYNTKNWKNTEGGLGFFNPKINELIGPESNIPLLYGVKFYFKQKKFSSGNLDVNDLDEFDTPINYLPEIYNHKGSINYLLGIHEFGDWNLNLYKRYIKENEHIKMHVFENSGHNIWLDQPEEFHRRLSKIMKNLKSQ